ncbi:DUF2127 domain-containing protein [Acidovorax sp. A1169]|uniref:DUF2127 domain-containing protein n=1 Tax=Acidovorax sp. A1169 TaxID=3059524 RepID=UPI002737B597|nr:DUF2127 domain-containing protein [Acidovorax sp. A1169]MDP4075234.1 DUF2127 domain-containing protein [Acidovorax sp. A1169]
MHRRPTPSNQPPARDGAPPHRQALRAIAAFEALKGFAALAASLGFVGLLHHDLHHIVASFIGHIGLKPGDRYPAMVLTDIDQLLSADLRPLLLAATAYVLVRFTEAYGLWNDRRWGEWLGALSGALYIPFELWHFAHHPSVASAAVALTNVAVVGFLGQQLWRRRQG